MINKNNKATFAKTLLSDTAHNWYDSQGYDKIIVKFATVKSHMLEYFIPSDYFRRARTALVAFKIG